MAGTVSPRTAAPQLDWEEDYPEHPVNELLAQNPGAQSPFGDDVSFPLPVESLYYEHPKRENRPHLAGH
jgi:hypothetical protein